jgi:hypothetical protein
MSWLLAHPRGQFLNRDWATLMAAYRHDRFKSADISLLITLLGKIGFSGNARGKMNLPSNGVQR